VHRSRMLFIVVLALSLGGGLCVAMDIVPLVQGGAGVTSKLRIGALLLVVGSALGATSQWWMRRECVRLGEQIRQIVGHARAGIVEAASHELAPLTAAVNELMESTEQAVRDALMQVKELELQLKVATKERHNVEAIIYSISDAVLVTDAFDEVLLANEAAARTFDFELSSAQRRPIRQILADSPLVELIADMRASGSKNERRIVEHRVRGPHGTRIYKVTLACVNDGSETPAGVVTVLHDMTKEKEVAQMKNDFVSSVSHELRTPLASINAYIEMLIDGEAEDARTQQEFYEVIQNEATRLSRLIDNILNISRIESGLQQMNKKPLSLPVVLKEAIDVITPQAKSKRINIVDKVTPSFYQTLADKDMLYQAVLNLLSNAVKYTPEGGTITVETIVDEAQKKVTTKISDTGVGIPPRDLPFVFDKFYRVEANNRMAKGTGLGLSLAKQIVESAHRGRLSVESTLGKGTTFIMELNLCE